jgi:hypothetical protein
MCGHSEKLPGSLRRAGTVSKGLASRRKKIHPGQGASTERGCPARSSLMSEPSREISPVFWRPNVLRLATAARRECPVRPSRRFNISTPPAGSARFMAWMAMSEKFSIF